MQLQSIYNYASPRGGSRLSIMNQVSSELNLRVHARLALGPRTLASMLPSYPWYFFVTC
jgi:hypothetical protein